MIGPQSRIRPIPSPPVPRISDSRMNLKSRQKGNPGSSHRREGREREFRGADGESVQIAHHRQGQTLALDVMGEYVVFLKTEEGGLGYGGWKTIHHRV